MDIGVMQELHVGWFSYAYDDTRELRCALSFPVIARGSVFMNFLSVSQDLEQQLHFLDYGQEPGAIFTSLQLKAPSYVQRNSKSMVGGAPSLGSRKYTGCAWAGATEKGFYQCVLCPLSLLFDFFP